MRDCYSPAVHSTAVNKRKATREEQTAQMKAATEWKLGKNTESDLFVCTNDGIASYGKLAMQRREALVVHLNQFEDEQERRARSSSRHSGNRKKWHCQSQCYLPSTSCKLKVCFVWSKYKSKCTRKGSSTCSFLKHPCKAALGRRRRGQENSAIKNASMGMEMASRTTWAVLQK